MAANGLNFDLIVIGSGPGGQKAALQAAKIGKKVALIEEYSAVGGGCVHVGTLPSKSFRESVYRWSLGSQGRLGQETLRSTRKKPKLPDIKRLLRRKDRVVSVESQIVFDQLKRNRVQLFHGRGKLISPHEVEVLSKKGTVRLKAPFLILAVGARPTSPDHIPVNGKNILDSDSILGLKKLPRSLIVLGAGIIGCEYASMFAMAGTRVHLVDRRNEILASVDREVTDHLIERFHHEGMRILLKTEAKRVKATPSKVSVSLSSGESLHADVLLVALGRSGNTRQMGLEEQGIQMDERGLIRVDEHFRTTVPHIYAVGDVIGSPALASTSMEQGRLASCHAFQAGACEMPKWFPYGIYTIPEISMIGSSEEELRSKGVDFVVGRARYRELARGQIVGDRWGLLKILVERKSLKLLAIHIVGDNAADLVHIGQAVMALDGDLNYFIENVFNYPTLAEAYKTAAFHAYNQIKPGKAALR